MLHDAAPDKGRWSGPQSHVGDSRLVAEFGWRIIGVRGGGSGSLCPSLWRASRDAFAASMAVCSTLVTAKTLRPQNSSCNELFAPTTTTHDLPSTPLPFFHHSSGTARGLYLLPHGAGPWRESSRCPSLIGLRPHPSEAEPWPLLGSPEYSSWPRGLARAESNRICPEKIVVPEEFVCGDGA